MLLPSKAQVTMKADGSFTYKPANGFTGTDTFTYVAYNGTFNLPPSVLMSPVAIPSAQQAQATITVTPKKK